jgi:hypothetical protein
MLFLRLLVPCTSYTLFTLTLMFLNFFEGHTQSCSRESITGKYWQYRKNLNKHFVLIDRDPVTGCVGDGIGQDASDPCKCSKSGRSLPATSIDQKPDGSHGMGDRNNENDYPDWYDPACADAGPSPGTHWDPDYQPKIHNALAVGSETPHQMGWYWLTLATEYQLLIENGQNAEAQRTLEELFLGLQAYRRLDITANCLVRDRYVEITNEFEVEKDCSSSTLGGVHKACLCGDVYREGGGGCEKKNFDAPCNGNDVCHFSPRTDGFSGFFLREDATQDLEILHDGSEDKWNIDVVNSDHAFSLRPPCTTTFSPACYNVHRQNFMSQDGVIGLMIGLTMIKRFIPPNATVTTCDGTAYSPLSIATQIASAITNRIDNAYNNRINWPKSNDSDCCKKEVFLSSCEGGHAAAITKGLKKACSYVDGANRNANVGENLAWAGLTLQTKDFVNGGTHIGDNANFWIRLKTLGWDMGGAAANGLYQDAFREKNLQIMPIINNILYPNEPNIGIDKNYFKGMLCAAPCDGPCEKRLDYPNDDPNYPSFSCPNIPDWIGQRWETHNLKTDNNRQFNGLDFLTLYNLYLLYFPEERTTYFNPDRPENGIISGANKINGPDVLCPVSTGHYKVLNTYGPFGWPGYGIRDLNWNSSPNLEKVAFNSDENTADFRANTFLSPSYVAATYKEDREVVQYYDGYPHQIKMGDPFIWRDETFREFCEFTYRKPILTETPEYALTFEFDHCAGIYRFHAVGPDVPNTGYLWILEVHPNGGNFTILTASGKDAVNQFGYLPGSGGWIYVTLRVTSECGVKDFHTVQFYSCGTGRQVIVAPNPARHGDEVYVGITDNYLVNSNGLDVVFVRTGFGTVQSTQRIYYNGQAVSIANFPVGNYAVQVVLDDNSVVTTTLVVTD